jgi:hypothetical protein
MRYPGVLLEVQSSALEGGEREGFQILEKKRIKLRKVKRQKSDWPSLAHLIASL